MAGPLYVHISKSRYAGVYHWTLHDEHDREVSRNVLHIQFPPSKANLETKYLVDDYDINKTYSFCIQFKMCYVCLTTCRWLIASTIFQCGGCLVLLFNKVSVVSTRFNQLPGVQVWNADFRQQMVRQSSLCHKDLTLRRFVVSSTSVKRARMINWKSAWTVLCCCAQRV